MLDVGLNPYGLTYHLGLQGRGTPRANPAGRGLEGFIALAERARRAGRSRSPSPGWRRLGRCRARGLRDRLAGLGMTPVVSSGLHHGDLDVCLARRQGARRQAHPPRADADPLRRPQRRRATNGTSSSPTCAHEARRMRAAGGRSRRCTLVIENHQDFTSRELVDFCEEFGPGVGIIFDTGNTFPVARSAARFHAA